MMTGSVATGRCEAGVMVQTLGAAGLQLGLEEGMLKETVSRVELKFGLASASAMAWRREPGPLSFVLTTKRLRRCASYAPMSCLPLKLRAKPRWSVDAVPVLSPASSAGLPGRS